MNKCVHDYVYGGLVNVFDGERFLITCEYWKCRKCGTVRAGYRRPGNISPTEGLLPEPEESGRWIIFLCKPARNVELYYVKPGEKIIHKCIKKEVEFIVDDEYRVASKEIGDTVDHYDFLLEDVSPGVIDLSKDPIRIIRST
ncbi:MAG: hypothetical protein QW724_07460 [Nitrososphaerota archaeon]